MEMLLPGPVSDRIELLRRQYLQLLEPDLLAIPDPEMLTRPDVQRQLYEKMFHSENLMFAPNSRYQLRVLKELVTRIENAISDPEEDEISDDLINCLTVLMATPAVPASTAALQKSYVTYTAPIYAEEAYNSMTVTTLESRTLLSNSGVTGLRTWEGALHLGAYIASPAGRALLHGKTVLELGAGTGFLSIFCAKHAEALHVLATDGDGGVVDDIGANIYLNGLEDSGRIKSTVLKWGHALVDELLSPPEEERIYELVLGADVTYDVDVIPSLVATLRDLFEKYPRMIALIAATVRNEATFEAFTNACSILVALVISYAIKYQLALHIPYRGSLLEIETMAGEHKKRQYWKHGRPRGVDISEVTGLFDGNLYTMYIPTRHSDTERFWNEFDHMSTIQLERARGVLGYRPTPKELVKLRRSYGESPTLIEEHGGLGIFHIGGRCAELLAYALTREDKRYEVQGVGIEAYEGSVFLVRPVSLWTQLSCRRKREKQERDRREKGKGKDGRKGDRGPPTGAQAGPSHDAKASAFRTVNSGHWAASRNGPWAFGGAG